MTRPTLDRGSIGYALALLVLAACGAAIVLIYRPPTPPPLTAGEPPPCTILETGTVATGDDVAACAAAWRHFIEGCGDGGALVLIFTPATRWALRAGKRPVATTGDDDVALLRGWCASTTPTGR